MNDQEHPDQTEIRARAREAFGWIEYGYIAASMYLLNNTGDGIGAAGDMQIDFRMQPRQMKAFMKGWQIRMDEQTTEQEPPRKQSNIEMGSFTVYDQHGFTSVDETGITHVDEGYQNTQERKDLPQ